MFGVKSHCLLDPRTSEPVGPGGLSTFVLALSGLSLLSLIAYVVSQVQSRKDEKNVEISALIVVAVNVAAYALYFAHWKACRPWTGWLLNIVIGVVAAGLVQRAFSVSFQPPTPDTSRLTSPTVGTTSP
jgi:uncharacterized membrane protein